MNKTPDITTERQSQLLSELEVLAGERAEVERTLTTNRVARHNAANEAYQSLREAEVRRNGEVLDGLEKERNRAVSEINRVSGAALKNLEDQETRFEKTAPQEHQARLDTLLRRCEAAKLSSKEQLETGTAELKKQWVAFEQGWSQVESQQQAAAAAVEREAERRRVRLSETEPLQLDESQGPPMDQTLAALLQIDKTLAKLRSRPSAKFFDEGWTVLLLIFTGLAAVYPAGQTMGWTNWLWAAVSIGSALLVTATARLSCRWRVRVLAAGALPDADHELAVAAFGLGKARGQATAEAESKRQTLKESHQQ